jgi:hypothetical protein
MHKNGKVLKHLEHVECRRRKVRHALAIEDPEAILVRQGLKVGCQLFHISGFLEYRA